MSPQRSAVITGVTGQDGSYLAELLLEKGYEVHGFMRRSSTVGTERIAHLLPDGDAADERFHLHFADLGEGARLAGLLGEIAPDEVYNLAAQSHVRISFDEPELTGDITGLGAVRLLEAIRSMRLACRYYQASSSEMFGASPPPQNELTPFHPRSPYGVAKVFAYWATRNHREAHGIFAVNGILFNHESPRRGVDFVTRKITRAAARIASGHRERLVLGNLDARRDWGYAPEYVEGMWRSLQHEEPLDVVLATGESHSVRDFLDYAFEHVGLDWAEHVDIDERLMRPAEVDTLIGDCELAERELGWFPVVRARELAHLMVDADLDLETRGDHTHAARQVSTTDSDG